MVGLSACWFIRWLVYQLFGLLDGWFISWLVYQMVGLSDCWFIRVLVYQIVGLSVDLSIAPISSKYKSHSRLRNYGQNVASPQTELFGSDCFQVSEFEVFQLTFA